MNYRIIPVTAFAQNFSYPRILAAMLNYQSAWCILQIRASTGNW